MMTSSFSTIYLHIPASQKSPEIGSRAFVNLFKEKPSGFESWYEVQSNRYQYAVGQSDGNWVKILISNYLACHIVWK